jgi:DNA-binding transcriptional regulator YhcF (GntR family)
MDGAQHEIAGQYALNTAASKGKDECKSVRQIAKEWGVPYVTLARYFAQPGYFETSKRVGAFHVLSRDDEKTIVDTIW